MDDIHPMKVKLYVHDMESVVMNTVEAADVMIVRVELPNGFAVRLMQREKDFLSIEGDSGHFSIHPGNPITIELSAYDINLRYPPQPDEGPSKPDAADEGAHLEDSTNATVGADRLKKET